MIEFYRTSKNVGVCSYITTFVIGLANIDHNLETDIKIDINLGNYQAKWEELFVTKDHLPVTERKDILECFYLHGKYNLPYYDEEDLKKWHAYMVRFVQLKPQLTISIQKLIEKYQIQTVTCVYFRGHDKWHESRRVAYQEYDKLLSTIDSQEKLWFQSDEKEFIDYMLERYPERGFAIPEFKTRSQKEGPIHFNSTINDAQEILQIVHLMASSQRLIASISNVTQVALIIRGNQKNYIAVH